MYTLDQIIFEFLRVFSVKIVLKKQTISIKTLKVVFSFNVKMKIIGK